MTTLTVSSSADLRDRVRDASARGTPLRIVGAGTWLDAGRPVRSVESISTNGLSGIVDYVPGDLTLTARAGTSLGEIRQEAGKHNQWLALDPYGGDVGTLGATIATASTGPLVTAFGTPRDLVLGIEFVTGTGSVARAGGRVVKNVAGFDLTRLMTGAWGTLGVITEATVRLHACPQVDETIGVTIAGDAASVDRTRQLLRRLAFTPYACEVLSAPLAVSVVGRNEPVVLVRVAGNMESVVAQRAALVELGEPFDVSPDAWMTLRVAEPPGAIVFRVSRHPSEIGTTWEEANRIAQGISGALLHATLARGIVRCIVPDTAENLARLTAGLPASTQTKRIGERLPEPLWATAFPSRAMAGIGGRLKQAFDPRGVLNPGILGDAK
ncbi:MAG TPA: FAD-binding protein [Gemmatimonadaceae bacterium]|nr:FAD-binding protein [Gemmatimonadaceae bacterium]